ncbi:low molecular weight protein-tyrosine-phosphatase [Arcobacter sp. FWKO B]|uniref:low molecular weight protein-tyrosine-phosphatase n=1 Tax=Arcobacter sp. FWKO B TaxID=2593672 RepID=UPI0018A530FF|nr:low molecular weight protein-tyrosine-phosphatase [Arcobacter sp. FWKO B]QOG12330.1 low molecular weight phosphotyrosine protein phosphatase [Arcobacter sp. FWKO B]
MTKILFVCLGNICRSPLAEGIAKYYISKNNLDIIVDSAGTSSFHIGENPCPHSVQIAQNKGIDISQLTARQVKQKDFSEFDLIIGLDKSNITNLKIMGCKNVKLLGDFGLDGEDIPDPYFFDGFDGFEKVFDMIEVGVINIINSTK